ncbi:TPA: PA3496 family putative envelope integrity protein [Vibrio parahaemolyticus]
MGQREWREHFAVAKTKFDWSKSKTEDSEKVKTRRKIEEIEEERRLKMEHEL